MKTIIFSPYATVVPHFETELEIAQWHLDRGDQVQLVACWGELANCDFNPIRDPERCRACMGRREMGLAQLSPTIERLSFDSLSITSPAAANPTGNSASFDRRWEDWLKDISCDSVEELKALRIDNFDIGYAVLSSLVSHCRDPQPDLQRSRSLMLEFFRSAWVAYWATRNYLQKHRPDRCYVFNGRFAAMRGVFRAAEAEGIDCYLHERGCDLDHFSLRKNHLPHDIPATERLIRESWDSAEGNPAREELAERWYQQRVAGVERNWHSFTRGQQPGLLPENWDAGYHNVTIFNSSDDEFVAIGDHWKNELYPDQIDGVARLSQDLANPLVRIYLRMHPNLASVENSRMRHWMALDLPNLTIIPASSSVDSYALMRASQSVVSFGSTAGIEAVFWGRPSILLGPCFYQNLAGLYVPRSHREALDLLASPLPSQTRLGAQMYGYWQQTYGIPHRHFQASGLFEGKFKGQTLYARPPQKTLLSRLGNEWRNLKRSLVRHFR
jgi:hypothetical protein